MAQAVHDAVLALGQAILALHAQEGPVPHWDVLRAADGTVHVRSGDRHGTHFVADRTAHAQMAWAHTTAPITDALARLIAVLRASPGLSWLVQDGHGFGVRVAPAAKPFLPTRADAHLGPLFPASGEVGSCTLAQMAQILEQAAACTDAAEPCTLFSTFRDTRPGDGNGEISTTLYPRTHAPPGALAHLLPLMSNRSMTGVGRLVGTHAPSDVSPLRTDRSMWHATRPLWEAFAEAAEDLEPGIVGVRIAWDASVHHHPIALRTLDNRLHDGRIWSLSNRERRATVERIEAAWRELALATFAHAPILERDGVFAAGVRRSDTDSRPIAMGRAWGIVAQPHHLARLAGLQPSNTPYHVAHLTSTSSVHVIHAASDEAAVQQGLALTDAPPHMAQASVWLPHTP